MKCVTWNKMRRRLSGAVRKTVVLVGEKAGGWLYVFKIILAVLLAMWISMRFELGQPVTAMVTVYVLMQPQSGMVLTKSVYRIFGTMAGVLACLALFALFPQERVLFLLGLSLWIGGCVAGATLFRNFKCYGFVLAGYTAAMIGLPIIAQPNAFFNTAVNRFTEVMVGILCAGLVSDLLFPQSLGDTIIRATRWRYTEFIAFTQALFSGNTEAGNVERMHLSFIGNVLTLESLRGAAVWEANGIRGRDACLRRLNVYFMAASTTLHSLHQLVNRLRKTASPAVGPLDALLASLSAPLVKNTGPLVTEEEAHLTGRLIASFRKGLPQLVGTLRHPLEICPDGLTLLDFDTGVELVRRFVGELHAYTTTYASLREEPNDSVPGEDFRFVSRTDPAMALLNGARAMLAVLLVALFWIFSAWPYGASAVMMVAIGCALFAPAADPARAIRLGLAGVCVGFVASFVCKFFIMPSLDGFALLCAALLPFMLVGAWLSLSSKTVMVSLGYNTMFCFMIAPGNLMQYDPAQTINYGSALALGLFGAAVMFSTFAPVTSAWFKRRIPSMLRHQVVMACLAPLDELAERFESGTRDLLHKMVVPRDSGDVHERLAIDWMFSVFEIGRAVIHLRRDSAFLPTTLQREKIDESVRTIERLFHTPTAPNRAVAIYAVTEAIDAMREQHDAEHITERHREALRLVLASLHCIRITLLDDETVLAVTVGDPATPGGAHLYAT